MRFSRVVVVAAATGLAATLIPVGGGSAKTARECEWLAGDLHVHTTYSHDAYGGPGDDNTPHGEFYTLGHTVTTQFGVAASRRLDFLAITDHNDVRSVADPGFGEGGVIPIAGYENSLQGHAQMLGARHVYDNGKQSVADVKRLRDELRADGGVFQINHPAEGSTDFPHDQDWAYGRAVVPDTVEVWNISRLYQPPLPSASSNDDAIRMWEAFLDDGHRVGATGGSDNHYVATTPVQGVGQPTTWVCAATRDEAGVLDGLQRGRTFISHQPPAYGGTRLYLEGDRDRDGKFESMVGDSVGHRSRLRVRVEGGAGSLLRLVGYGGRDIAEPIPVIAPSFTHTFDPPHGVTWVRAEVFEPDAAATRAGTCDSFVGGETTYCRNQLLVLAMTSAIFVEGRPVPLHATHS